MSCPIDFRRLATVALVACLVLAACSDNGDDAAETTTTRESTTTSESSTTSESTTSESTTTSSESTTSESTTTSESSTTSEPPGSDITIETLGLSLELPEGWEQDVDYGDWAFFGDDGFLVLTTIGSSDGLAAVAASEAAHVLAPYGSDPTIETFSVDGREARMIVPAADSPAVVEGFRQSAVIVALDDSDSYLAVFSDPANIDAIASSILWQT